MRVTSLSLSHTLAVLRPPRLVPTLVNAVRDEGREGVSTVVRVPTLVLVVTHPHTSTLTLVPIELSLLHAR